MSEYIEESETEAKTEERKENKRHLLTNDEAKLEQSYNAQSLTYTARDFVGWFRSDELDFQPEYQREYIWKPKKRYMLIDSMLRGYAIGIITIHTEEGKRHVLDGQQRLKTIIDFITETEPIIKVSKQAGIPKALVGATFSDLPAELQHRVTRYQIPVIEITATNSKVSDEDLFEQFSRMNQGQPLNIIERLNGIISHVRPVAIHIAEHPIFKNVPIAPGRQKHVQIAVQLIDLCEYYGVREPPVNLFTTGTLTQLYKDYKKTDGKKNPEKLAQYKREIGNTLSYLQNELIKFGKDDNPLKTSYRLIDAYLLMQKAIKEYNFKKGTYELGDFLEEFYEIVDRLQAEAGANGKTHKPHAIYWQNSQGHDLSSGKAAQSRLGQMWLEYQRFRGEIVD